jgi:hypothetical protein
VLAEKSVGVVAVDVVGQRRIAPLAESPPRARASMDLRDAVQLASRAARRGGSLARLHRRRFRFAWMWESRLRVTEARHAREGAGPGCHRRTRPGVGARDRGDEREVR